MRGALGRGRRLDDHRRPVAKHLRRPNHRAGVVANPHDAVGADSPGMAQHQLKMCIRDRIAQLRGTRRWDISTAPSELDNAWQRIPGRIPTLGPHEAVDMRPGDLLYLPRGTQYGVDSDAESLHVAVGFVPLTVREALLAVLDHLSDVDRTLRTTIGGRLAFQLQGTGAERLGPPVLDLSLIHI